MASHNNYYVLHAAVDDSPTSGVDAFRSSLE